MVTQVPVRIPDFSRDGRSGPNTGTDTGASHQWLFEYLLPERLYLVTWSFLDPLGGDPARLRIFKSVDQGITWDVQDDTNSPVMGSQVFDVVQSGNTLWICYQDLATFKLKITSFDINAANGWGPISALGPDPSI